MAMLTPPEPFNCVGRRLALVVTRLVLAYTVFHYGFQLAPEEQGINIHRLSRNQLIFEGWTLLMCVFFEGSSEVGSLVFGEGVRG